MNHLSRCDNSDGSHCIGGESLIKVYDEEIDQVVEKKVCELVPGRHMLWSVAQSSTNQYIELLGIQYSGRALRVYRFQSPDHAPILLTSGHKLLHQGKIVKARDHPEGKRLRDREVRVYNLITSNGDLVLMSGFQVATESIDHHLGLTAHPSLPSI